MSDNIVDKMQAEFKRKVHNKNAQRILEQKGIIKSVPNKQISYFSNDEIGQILADNNMFDSKQPVSSKEIVNDYVDPLGNTEHDVLSFAFKVLGILGTLCLGIFIGKLL